MRKQAYESWKVHASGMEFASELLIKAKKNQRAHYRIDLGLAAELTRPHRQTLRTWRDGMRHLLFILSEKPQFTELTGLLMVLLATALQIVAAITGPTKFLGMNIF